MAKTASTDDRTEAIINRLTGQECRAVVYVEYEDSGTWEIINDIDEQTGVVFSSAAKKSLYANFSLLPQVSTCNFTVISRNGKWSEGSTEYEAGKLDAKTKVRITAGYIINDTGAVGTAVLNFSSRHSVYYYTKVDGTEIILDEGNSGGSTEDYFNDFFVAKYGTAVYGTSVYTSTGYSVQTYDMLIAGINKITGFDVTANNVNSKVYYRTANNLDAILSTSTGTSDDWIYAGATINGVKNFALSSQRRYLQVAVVSESATWDSGEKITDITVNYTSQFERLHRSIYLLDTPQFTDPPAPEMPEVICNGQDVFAAAYETDYFLQDLSAGIDLDDLIKAICDTVGIKYTATSIVDLSAYTDRTLSTGILSNTPERADFYLEMIMQILNQHGATEKYWAYVQYDEVTDDMVLYIQPRDTTITADFVFNYLDYLSMGIKRKNYLKTLQRLTVITDIQVTEKETQIATNTITAAGDHTLSWVGAAEYKRYTITGTGTVTINDITPTSIIFTVAADVTSVVITVFGNTWNTTDPTYEGEWIDNLNMQSGSGQTRRLVNALIISDDEAKATARGFVEEFGQPKWEIMGIIWPYMNLLTEINDKVLVFSKNTFTDDIYYVSSITHTWNALGDSSRYEIDAAGFNFSDAGSYNYDDVMDYDTGYVYDMDLLGADKDDTEYNNIKVI